MRAAAVPRAAGRARGRRVRGCRGDWNTSWRPEGSAGSGAGSAQAFLRQPRHLRDGTEGTVRGHGGAAWALSEGWYGPRASREADGHRGGRGLREYRR